DLDVIVAEVAGPDRCRLVAGVEVEYDLNFRLFQIVVRAVGVEGNAAPGGTDDKIADANVDTVGIERHARAPCRHKQPAPVRIIAEQGGLDERRLGDGPGDTVRARLGRRAAHDDLDQFGRA